MVRKMGIKGFIKTTVNRLKSNASRQRKTELGIECFWSSSDSSMYEDSEALIGLR